MQRSISWIPFTPTNLVITGTFIKKFIP